MNKDVKRAIARGVNVFAWSQLRACGLERDALGEMNAVRAIFGQKPITERDAREGLVPAKQLYCFARASVFSRVPRTARTFREIRRTIDRVCAELEERGLFLF